MNISIGDVVWLRSGLFCYHRQARTVSSLNRNILVRIADIRICKDATFIDAQALNSAGMTYPEGALLTFAQRGPFRPEFIQTEFQVLRRLKK